MSLSDHMCLHTSSFSSVLLGTGCVLSIGKTDISLRRFLEFWFLSLHFLSFFLKLPLYFLSLCIYFLIIVFMDERPAVFTSHTGSISRAWDLSHYYSFLSSGSTVLISSVFRFKTSMFLGVTSIASAVAIFLVCPSFHICPESSLQSKCCVKGYTNWSVLLRILKLRFSNVALV